MRLFWLYISFYIVLKRMKGSAAVDTDLGFQDQPYLLISG